MTASANAPVERDTIDEATEVMTVLCALLEQERRAVVVLDHTELGRIGDEKLALMERLQQLSLGVLPRGATTEVDVEREKKRRTLVQQKAQELSAQARANQLLLEEASSAISDLLGLPRQPASYDSRARRTYHLQPRFGRAA